MASTIQSEHVPLVKVLMFNDRERYQGLLDSKTIPLQPD